MASGLELQRQRAAQGLCRRCGNPAAHTPRGVSPYCMECRRKATAAAAARRRRLRAESGAPTQRDVQDTLTEVRALAAHAGVCVLCGGRLGMIAMVRAAPVCTRCVPASG